MVVWVVTWFNLANGYRSFKQTWILHFQNQKIRIKVTQRKINSVGWKYRKHVSWKCRYPFTRLHGVITQKTTIWTVPTLGNLWICVVSCDRCSKHCTDFTFRGFKHKVGGNVFFREDGYHIPAYMLSEPTGQKYKFHRYENLKSRTG